MMLPTVFLSLEGGDESFVDKVQRFLPDGLAYFYRESFRNGEALISAMEERIGKTSMFVLFASKRALKSPWVGFEIDRARIAKIKDPKFRIIVVPIDRAVKHEDLPAWMGDYWVGRVGDGPREVARYIRKALITGPLSHLPGAQVFGRGALIDAAVASVNDIVLHTQDTPNVLVLAGPFGIGRRTFNRRLLKEAFPATPELGFGPEFVLPQFSDLADIYRALRQEIETDLPLDSIGKDLQAFSAASLQTQVQEIMVRLAHFGELGQAVTIVTGNGIFEESGFLKPWVPILFDQLAHNRRDKLVVVSNRLLHANELRRHTNVLQVAVPPLKEQDVRTLMIQSMVAFEQKLELPSADIIFSIGGHPGIARATAALVAQLGRERLAAHPADLFSLQEEFLGKFLNFDERTPTERDVLSVLSWVPQLAGDMLKRVVLARSNISDHQFAEDLSRLILECLVEVSGANYVISAPIRSLFRRKHGYGSKELMAAFSAALNDELERARRNNHLNAELMDTLAFMAAIEGGRLPDVFRDLLLPSTLHEIVRETYDRGHDVPKDLEKVVEWGSSARLARIDETAREAILSYVLRAYVRLKKKEEAERLLDFFDERSYRSRYYLRAVYLRVLKEDYRGAVGMLLKALNVGKYKKSVVGDLARCYQRLGWWQKLHELVREQEEYISKNPVLLDVYAGMLIAQNKFDEAEKAINALRQLGDHEAYAGGRMATLIMRRDKNYGEAQRNLTTLLEQVSGGHTFIRKLRAVAAAFSGDDRLAREDADFLLVHGGADQRFNYAIEARIKLAQGDPEGAEKELAKAGSLSPQDELLRASILEARADLYKTSYSDREKLKQQAAKIRAQNQMLSEFEVER